MQSDSGYFDESDNLCGRLKRVAAGKRLRSKQAVQQRTIEADSGFLNSASSRKAKLKR